VVRQRILVVDRRIFGADDDVAGIEVVDGHVDEPALHDLVLLERAVCLEFLHGCLLVSKWAARPDSFGASAAALNVRFAYVSTCRDKATVSSLAPRCTSMYYLGARCGP